MSETIHHGRNIKRFREMLGIKQEGLAYELGEEWTQKRVSILEQKDVIEQDILDQVAKILKVPAEAIKNFDEEKAIFNIQNNYDNANQNVNYQFSPIDKWIEAVDDIKQLYERLLQSEKEKIEILQKLLDRNL
ncbi:helix-turn-helix domain-containing protein [Dyadobacter sp. CY345]|uniref:helix-turn-helix domain-containing protein n=1 Tax=Dyadobacter sp. CY345 TaxID=2909335 RepID=UPI001F217206|nr:helix-turn-helix transcriptional regulator [Dyadobacter sp. CY345]MCF2446936.1 helix-turn-helix domain-containing protein [Dyadobacter sp. CY345]